LALSQEDLGGHAAEVGEGAGVAGEEGRKVRSPDGLGVERPAEAEHHDEQLRRARGVAEQVTAEAAPVGLGLPARRGLEAHDRLLAALPVRVGELLEDRGPALVAQGADLVEERGRGELGVVGEAGEQVVLVGVELARQRARRAHRRPLASQGCPHRVTGDPKAGADRPDREALPVQRDDVHPLLPSDHEHPFRSHHSDCEEPTKAQRGSISDRQ